MITGSYKDDLNQFSEICFSFQMKIEYPVWLKTKPGIGKTENNKKVI